MKALQKTLLSLCFLGTGVVFSAAIPGCGSDGGNGGGGGPIDRMGRAGINTAITDPFFRDEVASEDARHDGITDAYNRNGTPSSWVGAFADGFTGNLAILDALDTVCGNQLLAADAPAAPGRYDALAGVLADDRLFVNTSSGSCGQYLAVEANAIGITNGDCGGRTPLYDTIDTSYSVLAAGALSGVDDGVPADERTHSTSVFPFLAAP